MAFDFRLLCRSMYKALFASKGTHAQISPRRIFFFLVMVPLATLLGLFHLAGFFLDGLLFRAYRRLEVRKPVFIVGVFRSGTTFLHDLLSRDDERFTSMMFWEIVFAPSITEKKILLALGKIDLWLGGPAHKTIAAWENRYLESFNRIHKISLFRPEEDEIVLLNVFSSFFQVFFFPFEEDVRPLVHFDLEMPRSDRQRVMAFYKRCVQRHMYVFGKGRQFLSKNPAFSSKVMSLYETFPDAKIVCLVRSPFEVVPSVNSMFSQLYRFQCSPMEAYPMLETTLRQVDIWYRYPIEALEYIPEDRQAIVLYDTLTTNPEKTVLDLYRRFGFDPRFGFRRTLREESIKAAAHKSSHVYTLEQFGLDREAIGDRYRDIIERFGFGSVQSRAAACLSSDLSP